MSMAVAPFLPRTAPLIVGTEQIAHSERNVGRHRVWVLEPPVDVDENRPGVALIGPNAVEPGAGATVVIVSRLVPELKLEGILTAVDAMEEVNATLPTRLLVVGDGSARSEIEARAARVNATVGPGTVVLTGELMDPRPAYDLADVAIGMGGSALRALAFAKPLVVQGEEGYFRLLTPESLPEFLWQGWYGRGGSQDPATHLAGVLTELLSSPAAGEELGVFGRRLVEQRFSLEAAARRQVEVYEDVLADPPARAIGDEVASASRWARHKAVRKLRRWQGRVATDDFNAAPVDLEPQEVATGSASPTRRSSCSARTGQL
jgi:glycosyltransferase involved in cell wall biosynthesis